MRICVRLSVCSSVFVRSSVLFIDICAFVRYYQWYFHHIHSSSVHKFILQLISYLVY